MIGNATKPRQPRQTMLAYGKQWIDEEDIAAVSEVLRSDWLTTGPKVDAFEKAFAQVTGAVEAVAVSNGTAALHAMMHALKIKPGDEVIVPALTFAASANCVVYCGGTPVICDIDPETLLIDPASVESRLSESTRAVVAVDYAGQPCDYKRLTELLDPRGIVLVSDACHSLGGRLGSRTVGTLAKMSAFSFHPVKHITSGEGGMVTTDDVELAQRMRVFRNHGITTDHRQREKSASFAYEMVELGYNYRLCDIQCALGLSQLSRITRWVERRNQIARRYDEAFRQLDGLCVPRVRPEAYHAYHLYVVRLKPERLKVDRAAIFQELRQRKIGVNVHYPPLHLHPYYQENFGTKVGDCPIAEAECAQVLSLPMFPKMSDEDVEDVIYAVEETLAAHRV